MQNKTKINKEVDRIGAQAREKGLSYGQEVAKETMMYSDLLFWKRYNEFQKKQNNA